MERKLCAKVLGFVAAAGSCQPSGVALPKPCRIKAFPGLKGFRTGVFAGQAPGAVSVINRIETQTTWPTLETLDNLHFARSNKVILAV